MTEQFGVELGQERHPDASLARMWNGCVDHDPSRQTLSA